MSNDLISREALKKAVENLVVGGEKGLKDYYENGSASEENEWIGGVYDAWELINEAHTAETNIEEVISMLSEDSLETTEWFKVDTPSGKEVIFEKRNTGWWLPEECGLYWYRRFSCSKCENEIVCRNVPNYCQKCGAKMKGIYNEQKTADTSL